MSPLYVVVSRDGILQCPATLRHAHIQASFPYVHVELTIDVDIGGVSVCTRGNWDLAHDSTLSPGCRAPWLSVLKVGHLSFRRSSVLHDVDPEIELAAPDSKNVRPDS